MNNLKLYSKGIFTSYVSMIITTILGLFLTRFTLSYVSKEEYGFYTLIADILSWLGLLQFGASYTFSVRAAQILGTGDLKELNKYTTTSIYTQLVTAIIIIIIGIFLSFNLSWFINISGIEKQVVLNTFLISVITFGLSLFRQIYSSILIANKQIHIDNILNIILYLIQAILTVIFLLIGWSITSLAFSYLISTIIVTIINYYRIKNLQFKVEINKKYFSKDILRELFGTGLWFTIGGLAGILILRMDRFFMANYISLSVVTNFYITSKIYDFINRFFQSLVNTTRPYVSQLYGRNNIKGLQTIYDLMLNGSNILLVFVCSIGYIINPWFIEVWMGSDTYYLGDQINLFIAVNFILQSAILPNRVLLSSTLFRFKFQNLTRILEGLLKLGLSILLVKEFGISGLLVASIIACILGSTIFLNYLSNKLVEHRVQRILLNYASYLLILLLFLLYYIHNKLISFSIILIVYTLLSYFIYKLWAKNNKNEIVTNLLMKIPIINNLISKSK